MKGIKALSEDCLKYLQFKPSGPILLSISQIEELKESRSTKPFVLRKDNTWAFKKPDGKEVDVLPLMIRPSP